MLKRILLFLLLLTSPAAAQIGTQLTLPQMTSEINNLFPDNNTGLIIPADARKVTLDLANSVNLFVQSIDAGIGLNVIDPNAIGNIDDLAAMAVTVEWTGSAETPGSTNLNAFAAFPTLDNGDLYVTNLALEKTSPFVLFFFTDYNGGGQKFGVGGFVNCWSMGDCFYESMQVTFAGGPVAGDEGQALSAISHVGQSTNLQFLTVATVARTTCNTTTTQSLTAAQAPQTFTVASTSGCHVGDWVVLNQQITLPSGPSKSAVQLTGVGTGTLTAAVRMSYNSGITVTPALVLGMTSSIDNAGQFRVMVDESGTSYTTGTAQAANAGGSNVINGTSTSWSTSMVGGTSTNIGCWESSLDDYTSTPFGVGSAALHSWYEIGSVTSTTALTVVSWSLANSTDYRGFAGNSSAAYTIRPCVDILWRVPATNTLIAETTSTTWSPGDTVEIAINPYPDVTGEDWMLAGYSPGGSYRRGLLLDNFGGRHFNAALEIEGDILSGGSSDGYAWTQGIYINGPMQHGIVLQNTDAPGEIDFSDFDYNARFNSFATGLQFNGVYGSLLQVEVTANIEQWQITTNTSSIPAVLTISPTKVADLPACTGGNYAGSFSTVSDSNTDVTGATPGGSGSNSVAVYCNGGAWAVAASFNNPFQVVSLEVLGHTGTAANSVPSALTCPGFTLESGSSDTSGAVGMTSGTSCSIQFGNDYASSAFCVVSPGSALSTSQVLTTTTTLVATFGTAQTSFTYLCMGI